MAKGSTVKTKTVAAERPVARTGRAASRTEVPAAQPIAAVVASVTTTRGLDSGAVAARAYEIFEREGRPHGRDVQHWLLAEAELRSGASA